MRKILEGYWIQLISRQKNANTSFYTATKERVVEDMKRKFTLSNQDSVIFFINAFLRPWIYPKIEGVSPSTMLGSCGLPGNTAYFGLLRICEPKLGMQTIDFFYVLK